MNRETPRHRNDKAQEHDQGISERSGWYCSWRVIVQLTEGAGWWMDDDDSHGVEISIAGGVRKMVRGPNPMRFLFFFLYPPCIVFRYKKLRAALAMEKTKPMNQNKT